MRVTIEPGSLRGTVAAPPSKSMAHRMLICAALADGESLVRPIEASEDILATVDGLRALGAGIRQEGDALRVTGCRPAEAERAVIPCRESGSTLRFLLPLCLLGGKEMTLTGSGRLLSRPLDVYETLCAERGFRLERTGQGIRVQGRLKRDPDPAAHRKRTVSADDAGSYGGIRCAGIPSDAGNTAGSRRHGLPRRGEDCGRRLVQRGVF